ncbi:hypothetical protein [Algoriphagus boritolerans]|uniref:c-type cytochrome n=1 Tax=Algoriphagus boritolerans TaxID=308111 RepID=UPI000AA0B31D
MTVKVGTEEKLVPRKDIKSTQLAPSSMPAMGDQLSKRDIRDLVTYLGNLRRRFE